MSLLRRIANRLAQHEGPFPIGTKVRLKQAYPNDQPENEIGVVTSIMADEEDMMPPLYMVDWGRFPDTNADGTPCPHAGQVCEDSHAADELERVQTNTWRWKGTPE